MKDFFEELADLARRVWQAHKYLRIDDARKRLTELEEQASAPDLWDDADRARQVTSDMAKVAGDVEADGRSSTAGSPTSRRCASSRTKKTMHRSNRDRRAAALARGLDKLELRALFSGERRSATPSASALRRGRNRRAGLGADGVADGAALGRTKSFEVEVDEIQEGPGGRSISSGDLHRERADAYGCSRAARVPVDPHLALRRGTPAAGPRVAPRSIAFRARADRAPRSIRATCASTPTARRARAAST